MKRFAFTLCLVLGFLASAFCEDNMNVLQKKANAGDAAAQAELGNMYAIGRNGVYRDSHEAVKWLTKSAEQGNADGEYFLGVMYEFGRGVPKDISTTIKWFDLAAKQDKVDAQLQLARMYDLGRLVPQNPVLAAKYYQEAAAHGQPDAEFRLAQMYETGETLKQDYPASMKLYLKLVDDPSFGLFSQYKVGYFYQHGLGVAPDRTQAMNWYHKAASHNYTKAIAALKEMED